MPDRPQIDDVESLAKALESSPTAADLVSALAKVPDAVEQLWVKDYQPWFTDHGPNHSRRVAKYALELTRFPLLHESQRLTALEAFILWAAAWLHDIGMQDLMNAGPLGEIGIEGYMHVRHEHPDRSSANILEAWSSLGLPADDHILAETIAGVARAHGTGFYRDTIENRLETETTVRNEPVRSRLLAALLLFADELDLHYERVPALPGWAKNNGISQAHAFKHKIVKSVVSSCGADGQISVSLNLVFPEDLAGNDASAIRRWIEVKLRRQMGMIEPEVSDGFGGNVRFDRHIRVIVGTSRAQMDLPSGEALAFIRADVSRDDLINHRAEYEKAREAITRGDTRLLIASVGSSESGDDGCADLLTALCADAEFSGHRVARSQRAIVNLGANDTDVLEEWIQSLGIERRTSNSRASLLEDLVAGLGTSQSRLMLAIDRVELLDEESLTWLTEVAVPGLEKVCVATLILTGVKEVAARAGVSEENLLQMADLEPKSVTAYLDRYAARNVSLAESHARPSYAAVKLLAQGHELNMRGAGDHADA